MRIADLTFAEIRTTDTRPHTGTVGHLSLFCDSLANLHDYLAAAFDVNV